MKILGQKRKSKNTPSRGYFLLKMWCGKKIFAFFKLLIFLFFFFVFLVFLIFLYFLKDLPRPEIFTEKELPQSTKIYDRTGQVLLYEIYGEEKRTQVPLSQIPDSLKKAVIVAEDANFYHHFGVDLKGIARAILEDLKIGKPVYGGSTIPQQLIRSAFLSSEKSLNRKTKEVVLAIELDLKYPKDQILEWYLNQVPFGQNAYGVEAASQTYFGKSVSQISLAEAATLAALIQSPYGLSPYEEKGRVNLLKRKDYILDRLAKEGYFSNEEIEKAKKEEINFKEQKTSLLAPYFTLWVKEILEKKYGKEFLATAGWKIYTTLDYELQEIAEKVVREGIERNKKYNANNAGLVAIDPKTGEVLVMTVGTGNYYEKPLPEGCHPGKDCLFDPQFNVAVGTEKSPGRQPGSAFKPFIYATAFQKGYDDQVPLLDAPTDFGLWGGKDYTPLNYDQSFRGWVTIRQALAQSLNVPSIKVLYLIGAENKLSEVGINDFRGLEGVLRKGLEESLKTAKDLGITTLNRPTEEYGPAIVLGGGEVNLLEMTSAYGVFANDGVKVKLDPILKIEDAKGEIVFQKGKDSYRVLSKRAARLINSILSDNEARAPMFGPRSHMYFENYQVAVKTGTTNDFRDCWTIGYTPSIAVGVWTGNNNNAPMTKRQPAATVAGPIFHQFLEEYFKKRGTENFPDLNSP